MVTDGHWTDMQVTLELAMSPATTVHVTVLLSLIVSPSFSIVSEILMVPQTSVTEHLYVTLSSAVAKVLSTTQFGDVATERHAK